jgi:hypothetical protein
MRIFVLTANYKLRIIRKGHLRDHPSLEGKMLDPEPEHWDTGSCVRVNGASGRVASTLVEHSPGLPPA